MPQAVPPTAEVDPWEGHQTRPASTVDDCCSQACTGPAGGSCHAGKAVYVPGTYGCPAAHAATSLMCSVGRPLTPIQHT